MVDVLGGSLASKTLCPSAQQYLSQHYNLHSMFGHFESKATNMWALWHPVLCHTRYTVWFRRALTSIRNKRPFVLSRSTFAGSGRYTAHWTGDNLSSFDELHASISSMLSVLKFTPKFCHSFSYHELQYVWHYPRRCWYLRVSRRYEWRIMHEMDATRCFLSVHEKS